MDQPRDPTVANLLLHVTNLVWCIKDRFSVLHNISAAPSWVQSLWAEIDSLHVLAETAVRHGLDFNYLNGCDADNAPQLISLADNALQDLEERIGKLEGDLSNPVNILTIDRAVCCRYQSLLQPCRLLMANAMNRLQFDNMRRTLSSMQEPGTLHYVQHVNEAMSGLAELAFLQNDATISNLEHDSSSPRDSIPAPRALHPGRGQWIATTLSHSSRPVYQIRCSVSCRCRCHSVLAKGLPGTMRKTLKRLFPTLGGEPNLVHRCNRLDCRLRNAGRTRVIVLHTTLLRRAIETCILLHGIKFKIQPRVHPVVSESSDIMRFARMGEFRALRNLIITKQASPFDATEDGWTLLHNAAFQGHLEMVEFLLNSGADTNVAEIKLRKASHFAKFRALRKGATEREKTVAKLFPDQDFRYDFELSPIHSAVLHEYDIYDLEKPSLQTLLDFGMQLSQVSRKEEWTSWRWKYRNRSPLFQEMISYFEIAAGATDTGQVPFSCLLEQPDALQKWTPLQWAAFTDRKDELIELIEHRADPFKITPSGRNILHHAAESGTCAVLEYLLVNKYHEKGIDINLHDIWGETPLHLAAEKTPASVALFLQHGAALDVAQGEGLIPLHYTFLLKGPERVKSVDLFSNHIGCPLNARNEIGRTPTMLLLDSAPCVELLLDRGADIFICDNNDRSILHLACIEDQPQIIAMLLKKYPEKAHELATYRDMEGDTPLFTSFRHYHPQCARLLLTRAPISMVTDKQGWSLLHHAVKMGNVEVLELALSVPDVGIFARTNDGETAFSIARENNYMDGPIGETLKRVAGLDEETFQQLNRRPPTTWEVYGMIR